MPPKAEPSVVRMLSQVPIFAPLGEKMLQSIATQAKERRFAAADRLVAQGEQGIGFFLILDGSVEVRIGGKATATLGPGQFFGEMALLDNQPRSADVVGRSAGRCLVVSAWEFWGALAKEPEVIRLLFQETVRRLRAAGPGFTE